jgi:hypothetical protein
MAAIHGGHAAAQRCGLGHRVREVSPDPAIPAAQQGHEPWRVQVHLLVGVGPPPVRPLHRLCLVRAAALVCLQGRGARAAAADARRDRRTGRASGRHWLADGAFGPAARHGRRRADQADAAPWPRLHHLRGNHLDVVHARSGAGGRAGPEGQDRCAGHAGGDLLPDRAGRAGGRARCGPCLQHLAADGWRPRPGSGDAVRAATMGAELRRQRGAGAVQPPHRRLSAVGPRALACDQRQPADAGLRRCLPCAAAGRAGALSGRAGRGHAADSGSALGGSCPSGLRDCAAWRCGLACRAHQNGRSEPARAPFSLSGPDPVSLVAGFCRTQGWRLGWRFRLRPRVPDRDPR